MTQPTHAETRLTALPSMIDVPKEGRPTEPTTSDDLIGVDGNAFLIMGFVTGVLRRASASREFIAAYQAEATSGDYQHLLATSIAYLDADSGEWTEAENRESYGR